MTEEIPSDKKSLHNLIDNGTEIAGGAIGGALGFLAGGPLGAAALGAGGTVAAKAIKRIGNEVAERLLGSREKVRIGGVLALSAAEIKTRIGQGEKVRNDGFFESKSSGRSDGEEVTENLLLKSQREAEEKKLPYMAHLLASIAFDDTISAFMAHQLIKAAEQLTYRQFCLLRIGVIRDHLDLRDKDYRGIGQFSKDLYQILYECHDLYTKGFLSYGGGASFGPPDVVPAKMTTQGIGADLYNNLKLYKLPAEDLHPIILTLGP